MINERDSTNKFKIVAFVAIIIGFFMTLLDTTIVNISLPRMAYYFNKNVQDITWVTNGFNIAFAITILPASRLGDQFGRKKLFLFGLIAFTLTSCLAGFSTSLEMLIFIRVLQGLAAGIIMPLTIPLSVKLFSVEKFGAIIGIWGAVGGCASAIGPALGGILTNSFDWQAIFFVNLPFGVISFILSVILLKESYDKTASKKIDFLGITTIAILMLTVTLGLVQAPNKGWSSLYTLTLFSIAVISMILFIIVESKTKEPMLPLELLRIKYFTGASATMVFITAGMMASSFLVAFFLTRMMGMSSLDAGLTIIAMPITMIIFSLIAGPISHKVGTLPFAILGILLTALSVFLFAGLNASSSRLDVVWRLIISGAGIGMSISPLMGSAIKNAPKEKVGIASGVANVARILGMVLGVAILATLLSNNTNHEALKNKENIIVQVNSSKVLSGEVKKSLKYIISQNNNQMKFQRSIDTMNQKEKNELKNSPKEKDEVKNILHKIKDESKTYTYTSFSKTFKMFSIILMFGLIFAAFSDKPHKIKSSIK